MSACVSTHGEYSAHTPDANHVCKLCGVLDEDAMIAELQAARAGKVAAEEAFAVVSLHADNLSRRLDAALGEARSTATDRDSWRRVCERLEREKLDAWAERDAMRPVVEKALAVDAAVRATGVMAVGLLLELQKIADAYRARPEGKG